MKQNKPKTALDYYDGRDLIPENTFRISPSSFNTFMTKPHVWYREQVLKEDGFTGNTASVIGSVVHYVAECVGKGVPVDKREITQYILNQEDNEDVDTEVVRSNYKIMAEELVNNYVLLNKPTQVEPFVQTDLGNGVCVAGSIDAIQGDMIIDYKTYNSKTKPKSIPLNYKYQLLIYTYIMKQQGVAINRIRLVYINRPIVGEISEKTGKQLKSYPSEVTVLTEVVTEDDMEFIESCLTLCKDTYIKAKEDQSLVYLLYRDMRLQIKG